MVSLSLSLSCCESLVTSISVVCHSISLSLYIIKKRGDAKNKEGIEKAKAAGGRRGGARGRAGGVVCQSRSGRRLLNARHNTIINANHHGGQELRQAPSIPCIHVGRTVGPKCASSSSSSTVATGGTRQRIDRYLDRYPTNHTMEAPAPESRI